MITINVNWKSNLWNEKVNMVQFFKILKKNKNKLKTATSIFDTLSFEFQLLPNWYSSSGKMVVHGTECD
jgi:hypothetical protein